MKLDVVISGVGGQGSILASRALADAAMASGLNVLTSEVIGMAQREGPVTSHIRIGDDLCGALIPDREADFLIGLELSETVRGLGKLKPGGTVITSESAIIPVSVQLGLSKYDREAYIRHIREQAEKAIFLDLENLSLQAGNPRAGNVIIMGALSTCPELPLKPEQLLRSILRLVPEKYKEMNTRAFEIGRQAMEAS
ncbi:indolepyruvate oxidoreductase subunit beta [Pelotomaculum propionicicum]|uniref:indolepyruvate oxidoreductase subunit beta n=1 Tax=Pelotomaculum propionicicum TaxID=258475 RepID=UPI003B770C9A